MPAWMGGAVLAAGAALSLVAYRRPAHEHVTLAAAATGLALLAAAGGLTAWWLGALVAIAVTCSVWAALRRSAAQLALGEQRREELASQLDRRISELFSLQELSYVLSESIQLERIVEQVARYAARFLQADGAIVVLLGESGRTLHVAAAAGSLEGLQGRETELDPGAIVTHAIERDRIEVLQGVAVPSVELLEGALVRSAAVAPLRAHGATMGALAVADRREGPFTTEDLWLLSTVATQASVVLANGRLFDMVRRSKEEWETAFNALAEGIAVVGPDDTVQRANRSLARVLEQREEELLGRDLPSALVGDEEAARELIGAARRGDRPAPLVMRSESTRRVLRLTAAPLLERGAAEGASVVLLVEDVTDQQSMEAQLIQNEKMAAIGQLVSGVAHELNNPLTSIAGLTELLLERGPLPEGPREHLRVIHEQAERAGRIVRNLLTFARKGSPEKEPVDLNDVVARTSLLFVYELRLRGIDLVTRLHPEPVLVLGDRYELQQVLLNLVTNAAQAVGALEDGRARVITVETAHQGDQAVLCVRDSGDGVPPALVPYLFTPFFTTKAPGQGTGLGLSVSYGLIESHGGRLSYTTTQTGGAEFTITLPHVTPTDENRIEALGDGLRPAHAERPRPVVDRLFPPESPAAAAGAAATAPAPAMPAARAAAGGRRILVVDDDPAVHRIVSALFTPDGHIVEVTRSGENALRLARDTDFDLIIADAGMSAGPGTRFVPALLEQSDTWRDRLVVAAPSLGPGIADLFPGIALRGVTKPFNLRDLRSVAGEVLGQATQ